MEPKTIAWLATALITLLIGAILKRWIPHKATATDISQAAANAPDIDHSALYATLTALVAPGRGRQSAGRCLAISLLAMVASLCVAVAILGSYRDVAEFPWEAYHKEIGFAAAGMEAQQAKRPQSSEALAVNRAFISGLKKADTPIWAAAYSAFLVLSIVGANFVSLFVSVGVTRSLLGAFNKQLPLFHRVTTFAGVCAMAMASALFVLSLLGLLFNPALWLWCIIAIVWHKSALVLLLLLVAADLFAVYIQGAWLKALLATSLLPILLFLAVLVRPLWSEVLRRLLESQR